MSDPQSTENGPAGIGPDDAAASDAEPAYPEPIDDPGEDAEEAAADAEIEAEGADGLADDS